MAKIKENQHGFSIIEWLLLLLLLLIIGGAGWYVYQSKQNTEQSQRDAANAQSDPAKAVRPKDITEDWLLYLPPDKEYQIRLPDGWELERYSTSAGLYSRSGAADIVYEKGTKAKVTQVDGGRDFSAVSFALSYVKNSEFETPSGTKLPTSLQTAQGLEVTKYKNTVTTDPEAIGPPKGTTEFFYTVTKGNYTIYVVHDLQPGETDQTGYIEKALKTLEFN